MPRTSSLLTSQPLPRTPDVCQLRPAVRMPATMVDPPSICVLVCGVGVARGVLWWQAPQARAHMPSQTLRRLAFLEAGPLAGTVPRSASVPNLPRTKRTAPPLARGP